MKNYNQMKIGFGSCLKQDKPMPIFDSIKTHTGIDISKMNENSRKY